MAPVRGGGARRERAVSWLGPLIGLSLLGCPVSDPAVGESGRERVYGVQMHIHGSMSEGAGSMLGHNVMAARLAGAVDVLWWTDHDWRISAYTYVTGFDFEEGLQEVETAPRALRTPHWEGPEPMPSWAMWNEAASDGSKSGLERVWKGWSQRSDSGLAKRAKIEVSAQRARSGKRSLRIRARGVADDWERVTLAFQASRRRHVASLASGARLRLSVLPIESGDDARLVLSVLLSQHPPGFQGRLDYRLVTATPETPPAAPSVATLSAEGRPYPLKVVTLEVPQQAGSWNDLVFDVADDAERHGLGGSDNALVELTLSPEVRVGGRLETYVDSLQIERERVGEALFTEEKRMARGLEAGGLVNHVGQEISYGAHLNVFGPRVPLANPIVHPHGYTPAEAVEFAHAHDGIASLNHFFGVTEEVMGHNFPKLRKRFDMRLARLIASRAYGADLLEVGYRSRGHGLSAFLELWDGLSAAGVFITGVGVSDSHDNHVGWLEGPNNFITWVYAASPSQEDLIDGLRAGRAFFGDPARFDGRLDIRTPKGGRMGQVLGVSKAPRAVIFSVEGLREGQRVRLIRDGTPVDTFSPDTADFEHRRQISVERPTSVRFEVGDDDGPVALSNPLYFVPESAADEPPQQRRADARVPGPSKR